MKPSVKEIAASIEEFAPRRLGETWDNPGLQVGDPGMKVDSALVCLDVTEEVVDEARQRGCNLIISHHPLLFTGLKSITGRSAVERIVIKALREGIAIYAAHTNLDSARDGVSHEIARAIGLKKVQVLAPNAEGDTGLGVIGDIKPMATKEFLRLLRDKFHVRNLRYSSATNKLVVRRVAICGGAGASLLSDALEQGADAMVTGDVKYHDFTTFGPELLIADIGHYESELCTRVIFTRILRERQPDLDVMISERESNPIAIL